MEKPKTLSYWNLIAFSALGIPISALGLPFVVQLPAFYKNEIAGVSASAVGIIILLVRCWDVVTDPIFGEISDNTSTRWGRRRHWFLIAIPLQVFCAWYLFMPPADAGPGYLAFWLFLIYVSSTMIGISHMSWGAELSTNYHERARIQGYREFALIGGMIATLALPAVLGAQTSGETVFMMGVFVMVMGPLCALITLAGTPKEQVHSRSAAQFDFKEAIRFIAASSNLRKILLIGILSAGLLPGITGGLYVDTMTHVFKLGEYRNLLLLIYFAAAVFSVPFWVLVSKKFGKHKTLAIALFYGSVLLSFSFFMPRGDFWWMFWGLILYGVVYGCAPFLSRSLMADFADQDEIATGKKRTGLCYSLLNMIDKLGLAAAGIVFIALDFIGFDSKVDNSPETINMLLALYVVPSCACMLIAGWVAWRYPLDEEQHRKNQEILASRRTHSTDS